LELDAGAFFPMLHVFLFPPFALFFFTFCVVDSIFSIFSFDLSTSSPPVPFPVFASSVSSLWVIAVIVGGSQTVDLCGLGVRRYTGYDVSEELIRRNNALYGRNGSAAPPRRRRRVADDQGGRAKRGNVDGGGRPSEAQAAGRDYSGGGGIGGAGQGEHDCVIAFEVASALSGPPARADLVVIRDLLFHLTASHAAAAVAAARRSGARLLLATTAPWVDKNEELPACLLDAAGRPQSGECSEVGCVCRRLPLSWPPG
jgi:hypothetical protein